MALCLSVSVTSRCCIDTSRWIELHFGMEAFCDLSYTMLKGNSGILSPKNKGSSLCNFVLNSDFITKIPMARRSSQLVKLARLRWTLIEGLNRRPSRLYYVGLLLGCNDG